ncbi:hypothetical protein JYT87_01295, partial [Nitrospira defluvii]|nr:hypothetical protein [Nitrospira defluvii]
LNEIKILLRKLGGEGVMMSGSGPSIFGLFRDQDKAISVSREFEKQGLYPTSVSPILTQAPF